MKSVDYNAACLMNRRKVLIIVFAVITVVFAVGVTVSFVMLTDARLGNPEKLCYASPGDCFDKLVNGEIHATFNVNITVDGCDNYELVEMYRVTNCESLNKTNIGSIRLDYGDGYGDSMDMGANACRVYKKYPCNWDHGEFKDSTETPLVAIGATFATLCGGALITMFVLLLGS